jgi:glutamate-5-semialdehyde dehydrogenase
MCVNGTEERRAGEPSASGVRADKVVREAAELAAEAMGSVIAAPPAALDEALRAMAGLLRADLAPVRAANEADISAASAAGMSAALLDRLRLTPDRLLGMSEQLLSLATVPAEPGRTKIRDLPDGLVVEERRRPVGVIGANFEARPNVVVDIASQFIKSRNAGVLRTGSAALSSAASLADHVIEPALAQAGLDPRLIQVIREPGHELASALVRQATSLPLVIVRGSGASTRALAAEGAAHGVRVLAHADGGAVVYVDDSASPQLVNAIIEASLDRLGVCNRLNLLLIKGSAWQRTLSAIQPLLERLGVRASLPPHAHELGREWALEPGREATITVSQVTGPAHAALVANEATSQLAACVIAADEAAAAEFVGGYAGTGAFHNAPPRLLDGFKLFGIPETGINIDRVPGPRGPVTFRDLYLRQLVVKPKHSAA